jgi:hypothetical protein
MDGKARCRTELCGGALGRDGVKELRLTRGDLVVRPERDKVVSDGVRYATRSQQRP